ncbi:MAG TPA: hypothetical protein VF595_06145 [Tepidisphaeraceae bacterium]|jgi:hypothetical protein
MTPVNTAAVRENADVLSDFVLSEPPMLAHVALEEEMNRRFHARYVDLHTRNDAAHRATAVKEADKIVAERPFKTLGLSYNRAIIDDQSLTPHLLVACLRRYHGVMPIAKAEAILDKDDERFFRLRDALLDLILGPPPKKCTAVAASPAATALTSTVSSPA